MSQTYKPSDIVRRIEPKERPVGAEIDFSPDYTVTSTTDGGGTVLTNVEVILCFWGEVLE